MQAIILAAGMGKRLKELTQNATKCMVEVNGVTMIERVLGQLDCLGLSKIVLVVGYEARKLQDYVNELGIQTKIEFVCNEIYYKTNNIYSLYLARDYLLREDTLLLESDLIFENGILEDLLAHPYPNLVLVAKFESWMDGTVVTLDEDNNINSFLAKKDFRFEDIKNYYKTVNIYKFSKDFSVTHYVPFLEAYSKALGNNEYYEQVLKVITLLDKPDIKALPLEGKEWYEIDDVQDLDIAESIFASPEEKLNKIQNRYGGYWRYPRLTDFCYLVNPFYPNQKLLDEMKANFERLIVEYPSGMYVNSLLMAKYYGLRKEQVCVGNGAAELIKALMEMFDGKIGIIYPTFQEYPNRKGKEDIVAYTPENSNYQYTAQDIMNFFADKDLQVLTLINPDNPSGNYIMKQDVLALAKWADERNIRLIVDESFVDFVDKEENPSFLERDILEAYPRLIVIKSISKSFGVPGLRLGVAATNDLELIEKMKKDVAIWNVNSLAEFYLQIFEKYQSNYKEALEKFKVVRREYVRNLESVAGIRVIPSQANYIMIELTGKMTARELTRELLVQHQIFIKDLSPKLGKEYIRIAVKRQEENNKLVAALKDIMR
ncbi:MAG: aminotransferase class I/II-fold pyridoxal phosphate-dependent enzyme [Lachnospiraceae bacterium]|nr:aminotransferase class I/II-fold pyridoxal phosphate-dependent enzyme [Lachnospiraceae bacterium]